MTWDGWVRRVLEVLGLGRRSLEDVNRLPRPWFLVPLEEELSDTEATELFVEARSRLLQTGRGVDRVEYTLERIRDLDAPSSLPLLYAMRHVAHKRGRLGNYWPAFQQDILRNEIGLDEVQTRLAPELAALWLQLYHDSGQALYYPREGRRYIKWPLAHAGLLRGDEQTLEQFCRALVLHYEGDASQAPLDPDELDEFLATLSSWLNSSDRLAQSRLAKLLDQKDSNTLVVAELAQRWVKSAWESRVWETAYNQHAILASERARLMRRHLAYDADKHRLCAVLESQTWPGRVSLTVEWNGQRFPIVGRYVPGSNVTEVNKLELPLRSPHPSGDAYLELDEYQRFPFDVPSVPRQRGLVFQSTDGRAIREWEFDDTYFVLVRGQHAKQDTLRTLFDHWTSLGQPDGHWDEYEVLWVHTRQPPPSHSGQERVRMLARLEEAAERLGLPSFNYSLKPRIRLVGGRPLQTVRERLYKADGPPYVQVLDLPDSSERLQLSSVDSNTASSSLGTDAIVLTGDDSGSLLQAFDPNAPPAGHEFVLQLGQLARTTFRMLPPTAPLPAHKLGIDLELEGETGAPLGRSPVRRELERGTLVLKAWPSARLNLTVSSAHSTRTIPLEVNDFGTWRARWRDLGIGTLAPGLVKITASWRNLVRSELTCADAPYVLSGDITARKIHDRQCLDIHAEVSNIDGAHQGTVIAFGARPWQGELWSATGPLEPDGTLNVELAVDGTQSNWVAVLPQAPTGDGVHPWGVKTLSSPTTSGRIAVRELQGDSWDEWERLAHSLRGLSLPTTLNSLVAISSIGYFLRCNRKLMSLRPRWVALQSNSAIEHVHTWAERGLSLPVAFFASLPQINTGLDPFLVPPYLTPTDAQSFADMLRGDRGETTIGITKGHGKVSNLAGVLCASRANGSLDFSINTQTWLFACSKCGLVLDPDEFWEHRPPVRGQACTDRNAQLRVFQPWQDVPLIPAVLFDPTALLSTITNYASGVAGGEETPDHGVQWLEHLRSIYLEQAANDDPVTWITTLGEIGQEICRLVQRGHANESDLVPIGYSVEREKTGLRVLLDWLAHEVGVAA